MTSPTLLTTSAIAQAVGGELKGDSTAVITGISSLEEAAAGDLSFVDGAKYFEAAAASTAAAFLVSEYGPTLDRCQIIVNSPRLALVQIIHQFFTPAREIRGIDERAILGDGLKIGNDASIYHNVTIGTDVRIGQRVTLYPGVFIGDHCVIGDDVVMYPNVSLRDRCEIGSRALIHEGVVIGADGFGFVPFEGRQFKVPHIGRVLIGDDVEIGANTTIDRATFGAIRIGNGVKIDNLVQVAHNVTIGDHSIIVAQVGIAGSCKIGSHVVVGGQAGLAGHLSVGDRTKIAARSGIAHSIEEDKIYSGAPAMPHHMFLRSSVIFPQLPEMRKRIRRLEKRLDSGEPQG